MDFIKQFNAFEVWLETNYLPGASQLVWYKLFILFNRCGWSEWITVDNPRLMALTDIRSETTFTRARDKLLESGLLEYQKGKKGAPNRYKITILYTPSNGANTESIRSENDGQSGADLNDINKLNKTKLNKTNNKNPHSPLSGDGGNEAVPKSDTKMQLRVIWEKYTFSPALHDAVKKWLNYKAEKKKAYKPQGLNSLLSQTKSHTAKYGDDAVINLIHQCMANNWEGVIWDKLNQNSSSNSAKAISRYENYRDLGDL